MLAQGYQHLQHLGVLIFREKIDLKIQVTSLVGLQAAAILAHQDKQREKNRFQGNNHGEQRKRKRIERRVAALHIERNPHGKPDCVDDDEPHSTGLGCDKIPHAGC